MESFKQMYNSKTFLFLLFVLTPTDAIQEFKAGIVMVEKSVLPFKQEMVGPAIDMAIEVSLLSVRT